MRETDKLSVFISLILRHKPDDGVPVILKVYSSQMSQDGIKFYLSENGVWLTRKVDVKYLELRKA